MSTTTKQDNDFRDSIISRGVVEEAIDWMRSNLSPEDIFTEKELLGWARNFDPEGVFPASSLESWAENNGWTK